MEYRNHSIMEGMKMNEVKFDPFSGLPLGLGFDEFASQDQEALNTQKIWNKKVMDEIVTKLGYLDYRDVLVCNKYVLEAKTSLDA